MVECEGNPALICRKCEKELYRADQLRKKCIDADESISPSGSRTRKSKCNSKTLTEKVAQATRRNISDDEYRSNLVIKSLNIKIELIDELNDRDPGGDWLAPFEHTTAQSSEARRDS